MRLFANLKIALRALGRNRLRSILTALGIIIGVAAVIAMVSIGAGARAQVEGQIAALGDNILIITPGSVTQAGGGMRTGFGWAQTLTLDDAEAISREIPSVKAVSAESTRGRPVTAGNQNWTTTVQGQNIEFFDIRSWPVAKGELFNEAHLQGATKVCVIGQTVARQLFGDDDPVGQTIRVRGIPLTVLGVLATKGVSFTGRDQDDTIFVPVTTMMRRIATTNFLQAITVQVRSRAELDKAQQQITGLLRERHRIAPGREDDFAIRSQADIAHAATATTRTMTVLLGAIAGVSLIVGGIGIMNIMLVSVTERTREIGIRMAIGARGRDILFQFVVEAVFLASLGGALGVALGVGTSQVMSDVAGWATLISHESIVVALIVSASIGIFFGWYPARKAAALDPIEALRYE